MRTAFEKIGTWSAIRDEWLRLYAMSEARFFLSPGWIEALLAWKPDDADFHCLRVFDDLRGVYGMAIVGAPTPRSFAGQRIAHINESGDPAIDRVFIEYNDILLAKGAPDDAREAAIAAVFDALPRVEEFVIRNARPALASAAEGAARAAGFAVNVLSVQPTFAIDLTAPVFNSFSPALRTKIRRSIRRYEARGPLRIERPVSEAERAVAWTSLMRLHARTWSQRDKVGVFNAPDFTAFHLRLVDGDPERTDLLRLVAGDETIGVLYNFIDRNSVRNYQSGFYYESDNQLAPGFVAHALAAEHYRSRGFACYDLMAGDAEYKRRLGAPGESLTTLALIRPTLRMKLRERLKRLRRVPGANGRRT